MKLKILKGEALFSEQGLHILGSDDVAVIASEDTECEIAEEHFDRVKELVVSNRLKYGFDEDGNIPQPEQPKQPEEILVQQEETPPQE